VQLTAEVDWGALPRSFFPSGLLFFDRGTRGCPTSFFPAIFLVRLGDVCSANFSSAFPFTSFPPRGPPSDTEGAHALPRFFFLPTRAPALSTGFEESVVSVSFLWGSGVRLLFCRRDGILPASLLTKCPSLFVFFPFLFTSVAVTAFLGRLCFPFLVPY